MSTFVVTNCRVLLDMFEALRKHALYDSFRVTFVMKTLYYLTCVMVHIPERHLSLAYIVKLSMYTCIDITEISHMVNSLVSRHIFH